MGGRRAQHISIGPAADSDVDDILALAKANSAERGGGLTGTLAREAVEAALLRLPSVVARRGRELVGFLLTCEKHASTHPCVNAMLAAYPGPDAAYVYGPICVTASARGQRTAQAMFGCLLALLPDRPGILFINAQNKASLRAHRRMGMRERATFTYHQARFFVFAYND